jgi:hypothetical protein
MAIAPQPAMLIPETTTRRPQPRLAASASRRRVLSPVPEVRTGAVVARIAALVAATAACVGLVVSAVLVGVSGVISQLGR